MKKVFKNSYIPIVVCIALIIVSQVLHVECSNDSHEDLALGFVQNALPIDISEYEMTLTPHIGLYASAVECTLKSEQSVLTVNFYIQNNTLRGCNLYVKNGSVMYDKPYANIVDVAIGFLERYQTYVKRDSTEILNTLTNVDTTKNSTVILGNIKLVVTAKDAMGAKYTNLDWRWNVEGVDYPVMSVSFENEVFYGFTDSRGLYTIGDTTVNISKEQAIATAMEYLKTYSYEMPGYRVSGFKVNEALTRAKLTCGIRNSSVLYPMWHVILFLNHTYPGSINALQLAIWADSGQVFSISGYTEPHSPPKYYDPSIDPDRDSYDWNLSPNTESSNSSPEQSNPQPLDTYLVVAAVPLSITGIVVAIFIKKRK